MTSGSNSAWFLFVASFVSRARRGALLLALAAPFMALAASAAQAESTRLQIPGASFVQQCPCTIGIGAATVREGVLTPDGPSTYYAPLPYSGIRKVCSLTAYYRDVNELEKMTVGLYYRNATLGAAVDEPATLMAEVTSAPGVQDSIRKVTTSDVTSGALKLGQRFYFVKVDFDNINMDLLGVQVEMRDACS
jgi:hypothetical protein